MAGLLLSRTEQDIVVFHLFPSLSYRMRLMISVGVVLIGMFIQYLSISLWPGIIFVIAGSLLLVVKGHHNRIKVGKFNPSAQWEKVDKSQVDKILGINKKMKKWDKSFIDITSGAGIFMFIVIIIASLIVLGMSSETTGIILVSNVAALLIPYWFTGVKKILTTPGLVNKIKIYNKVLHLFKNHMAGCNIEHFVLLQGKESKFPKDIKLRISFKNQNPDFLGLYAQITTNDVSGKEYPYFYIVLVAKKGYGLKKYYQSANIDRKTTKEFSTEGDVEVFVIRQYTTRTTGYHTNSKAIVNIFKYGLENAKIAAVKK